MASNSYSVYTAFKAKDGVSPVFKNMSQNTNNLKGKISGLSGNVQVLGKALKYTAAICTAVYAAFSGFAVLSTKTTLNYAKEVKKMQRLTGTNVEDASKMTAAGQRFGVSSEGMGKALRKLTITAQSGSKEFKAYGLKVKDTHGKFLSAPRLLEVVANKYKKLGGGLLGAAFAQKVMGKSAMEMIPILEKGSGGIRAMYEQAERMGLVLSNATMKGFEKFAKAQKDIKQASTGIQIIIGSKVLPYFAKMAEKAELFIQNFDFRQVGVGIDAVFKGIDTAIVALQPVIDKFKESFKYVGAYLFPIIASLAPQIQMLFTRVIVPGLVLTIDVLEKSFVAINTVFNAVKGVFNFVKNNWLPILLALPIAFVGVQFAIDTLRLKMALMRMEGGLMAIVMNTQLMTSLSAFTASVWESITALAAQAAAFAMSPVGLITMGVMALVGVTILLWKNWDKVTATVSGWWNSTQSLLTAFWAKCQKVFSEVGLFIKNNFVNILLGALGPVGLIIQGLLRIPSIIKSFKGGGGIQINGANGQNVQNKTVNQNSKAKNGKIDVGVKIDNSTAFPASSSLRLQSRHGLTLNPA